MDTSRKIAVITGAGSGIGRATAHALLEAGWTVVLAGRRRDMLEETAALAEARPPRTLVVPTDVRDPAAVAALFEQVKADLRPHRPAVQQCRDQHPRHPVRGSDLRAMVGCRRGQPDRLVPLRPARLPHDEGAGAAGRAHHQQRLGLGACAAAQFDPLCLDQARADRADPLVVARRARIRHRLRPDRHRQRRDDAQRGHRARPAAGHRPGRGRAAHGCRATSPEGSSTWPSCRSKPTSSS